MAKKIYTDEEARQRKILHQKEYAQRTHYASNNKHLANNYTHINLKERKDIAEEFKQKCVRLGVSQREILLKAITDFLEEVSSDAE